MKHKIALILYLCFALTFPIMGQDQKDLQIAENAEKSMSYLKSMGLPIRSIDKIPGAILGLDCDSNIVAKQNLPIGFCYWTVASERYYSVEDFENYKVLERIKDKLGSTYVISGINYQGNITVSYLYPKYFVIRGDSLFERIELDSISPNDVIFYKKNNYVIRKESIGNSDNLTKEIYIYDRFIFSNSKVIRNSLAFVDEVTKDSIELQGLWKFGRKKYYEIRIKKPNDNEYLNYSLQFDDKFRFVAFEADCHITSLLTEESNQVVLDKK